MGRYFFIQMRKESVTGENCPEDSDRLPTTAWRYLAAIVGLEALIRPCQVDIYSDSQYLVKAFNEHWIDGWKKKDWKRNRKDPVKNEDLWKRLLAAMEPHEVSFHWVKGHAGHPENERCDAMAVDAALGDDLPEDEGMYLG